MSDQNRTTGKLGPSRGDDIIDYDTAEGVKTYKRATAALKDEYDGKSEDIAVFRMQLLNRCKAEGWSNGSNGDVINIPRDGLDASNGTVNVIKQHSQISKEKIELWANNHILTGTVDRRAQNNENISICINSTLTKKFLSTIDLKESAYTMNGVTIAPLLIKLIMQNAEMDTMVTSAVIRTELQHLDTKMVELNSNVKEFIEFVEGRVQKLKSRGEVASEQDLIINIMKALKVVKDKAFREQFKQIDFEWLSGDRNLTSEGLLHKADTYYKVRKQNNSWGELSKEEHDLIAMQAKFKDMNLRLDESRKSKKKKNERERYSRSDQDNREASNNRKIPKWKLENKNGKDKLEKLGKTYFWCLRHNDNKGMWVLHKPHECQNKPNQSETENCPSEARDEQEQAMPATIEHDSDEDSDSDESEAP